MYPEVRAAMARARITLKALGENPKIACTTTTMCKKLNGSAPLTLDEAVAIKEQLHSDLSIEELFKIEA